MLSEPLQDFLVSPLLELQQGQGQSQPSPARVPKGIPLITRAPVLCDTQFAVGTTPGSPQMLQHSSHMEFLIPHGRAEPPQVPELFDKHKATLIF